MFHLKKLFKNIIILSYISVIISYLKISHNDHKDCGRLECPARAELCTIEIQTDIKI